MLDHVLGDNPTPEQQIAIIANSLSTYIEKSNEFRADLAETHKDIMDSIAQLRLLQREQNGNVAKVVEKQRIHDQWHGDNDINISKRMGILERDKEFRDFAIKVAIVSLTVGMTIATFIQRLGLLDNIF